MKMILKITGIIVLVLLVAGAGLFLFVLYRVKNIEDKKDLQAAIHKSVTAFLAKDNTYGIVIGVYKAGRTSIMGYGSVEKGTAKLPDSNTLFELASTSKLFTTSTLQILCDKGLLNLDDKIADLLKGKVELPPIAAQTTLRHLATHTSGFPSLPEAFIEKMTDENNPYAALKMQDLYDYLKTCTGKQKEGTFEYSNFGMGLLGQLIALKTNIDYEALVKMELLSPLAMNATTVTLDSASTRLLAQGYNETGAPNPVWTDHVLTGAGSFISNASDMITFIKANLPDGGTPVSGSLLKTQVQQGDEEMGLGWILPGSADRFIGNSAVIWHNGMAGGYASYLSIDKATQSGLIILSNKAIDVTSLGVKLTRFISTQSWKE
jgi:D-alanyl-D-alanine-carboxypeptidase/D-alanyl-D-alanine-endopeptidase